MRFKHVSGPFQIHFRCVSGALGVSHEREGERSIVFHRLPYINPVRALSVQGRYENSGICSKLPVHALSHAFVGLRFPIGSGSFWFRFTRFSNFVGFWFQLSCSGSGSQRFRFIRFMRPLQRKPVSHGPDRTAPVVVCVSVFVLVLPLKS